MSAANPNAHLQSALTIDTPAETVDNLSASPSSKLPQPDTQANLIELSSKIGKAIAQENSLADMLEICVEAIEQSLNAAFVRIWTFDAGSNLLELQAVAGQHAHTDDFPSQIPLGISIIGLIAHNREPYVTNQVAQAIHIGSQDWLEQEQIVAFAAYPLVVVDQLVGIMALFRRQPIHEPIQQVLQWSAQAIAVAIDRIYLRERLLSRRETILFRLANQIRNSLDLDTVLEVTVKEIRQIFEIDRCNFLWCWAYDTPASGSSLNALIATLAVTHEAKAEHLTSLLGEYAPERTTGIAEKILGLQILQADNIELEPNLDQATRSLFQDWGMVSYVLIPLETRSGQMGAILCGHASGSRTWNPSEVELLQAVADQLAIAIDQAELYAQSRATAFAAQTQAQQLSDTLSRLKQTQAKLIQSEKMSSLGQLVAGIAHEINNPVSFISGNLGYAHGYFQNLVDLLKLYEEHYTEPVQEIQDYVEAIDLEFLLEDLNKLLNSMAVGADRIRQIVLSLRNFSRLDEAEVKPVNIHEGLDNTLLILQNRLKPNGSRPGITVVKEYGELPRVECYAGPLNQVFMNLLSNSIDVLEESYNPESEHFSKID